MHDTQLRRMTDRQTPQIICNNSLKLMHSMQPKKVKKVMHNEIRDKLFLKILRAYVTQCCTPGVTSTTKPVGPPRRLCQVRLNTV